MWAHGDDIGESRRAAENISEEFAHGAVGFEDGEKLDGRRHLAERLIEIDERGVGIAGAGEGFEQRGNELCQNLAGARRLHRRPAAEMPAAHGLRRQRRIVEAHAAQSFQRLGIVGDAGENEVAGGCVEARRVLEQFGVMRFDAVKLLRQRGGEFGVAGIAAEFGEARQRVFVRRQALRLLIVHHLQAMLDGAQIGVGDAQVLDRVGGDPTVVMQLRQHVERARTTQLRSATAENELLRLNEKLDLADAAATELHVVALDLDLGMAAHGVDLPLHRMDVGNGGVIEIFAPDERREIGDEPVAERQIAGNRTGLDERRALPVLPHRLVIGEGRRQRDGHGRRTGIRAQAQIDAQHIAVAGALLQNARQGLGDAHEERRRLDAFDQRRAIGIVEDDEIDITRIIQLARAVLAERENDKTTPLFGVVEIGEPQLAAVMGLAEQITQSAGHESVGGVGQRARDLDHIPDAADVGERNQQMRLLLGATQRMHQVVLARRRIAGIFQRRQTVGHAVFRPEVQQALQARQVESGETPEIGRMVG